MFQNTHNDRGRGIQSGQRGPERGTEHGVGHATRSGTLPEIGGGPQRGPQRGSQRGPGGRGTKNEKNEKNCGRRERDDPLIRLSKKMSRHLRHSGEVTMKPDGFVRVQDLLALPDMRGFSIEDLRQVVESDQKTRYNLVKESDNVLWIRANQGHSLDVPELELKPITQVDQIRIAVHGSYQKHWLSIQQKGLMVMGRNHVHFAICDKTFGTGNAISGMRGDVDLLIYLDVAKLLKDKIPIFLSANNVVLCAGIDGVISPTYFAKVVTRDGRSLQISP